MEDLPLLTTPHVCELAALRRITTDRDKLTREEFNDGRVRPPFYLLARICDVEGAGTVRLAIYNEGGERVGESSFDFGEEDLYYSHIICFEHYGDIPAGTYRVAVFLNGHILDERPLRIHSPDPPRG